ncbi:MAG TPA: hypothetical protein VI385_16750 [Flavisolibacter sp.]
MTRTILALSMLLTIATGCVKSNTKAKLDPNVAYYMKYETSDQAVKMRVIGDTLRLNFNETINVLVDPKDYANSWAIHLNEDFSQSYLNGLHFDALATAKGYAHDWVPINLNDAAPGQKTATNVTEDGKQYVKVTITRVFEFYNVLSSNQAAVAQQNTLLNTTNQTVTYKLYYSDGSGYSKSNDGTFKLVYSNQ